MKAPLDEKSGTKGTQLARVQSGSRYSGRGIPGRMSVGALCFEFYCNLTFILSLYSLTKSSDGGHKNSHDTDVRRLRHLHGD